MKLIAHRGLLNGPDRNLENLPEQILHCLSRSIDCEIDVWLIDNKWMLGHDSPQYEIDINFIKPPGLWIHAKNLDALYNLSLIPDICYFWHQEDDFTLTSTGFIWTYPGKPLTARSIAVLPEWHLDDLLHVKNLKCFGVCSDYVDQVHGLF